MKRVIKPETGKPYWRISISENYDEIILTIENFEFGWLSGEGVGKYFSSIDGHHVSYITKDRQEITKEVENKLIEMFYQNINKTIKKHQKEINQYKEYIKKEKKLLKDDMFKTLTREKKLKRILK